MQKILLFSHSGFSDEDANGITMKNLLSAWTPEEKAELYCDVQKPDYSVACQYFRLTDMQVMKSFLGKKSRLVLDYNGEPQQECDMKAEHLGESANRIPIWLKKLKYNFLLKWVREYMRLWGPWGQKTLAQWIDSVSPAVLIYMVGESIFLDKLVLKTCEKTGKPLVLYNGEAYRIIELSKRKGLEKAYYRKVERSYAKLDRRASLVIYNSELLKAEYMKKYAHPAKTIVAYNSAECNQQPYIPGDSMNITYFGNLGVGRSDSLLQVAEVLKRIDPKLKLDIYGNATEENAAKFRACNNIGYHGFINAEQLHDVIAESDILLHVESFDEKIMPKLKYAFSTKIAQCLCAGRCFVSYAPRETASSRYLKSQGLEAISDKGELEALLTELIQDADMRKNRAEHALRIGRMNHQTTVTAECLKKNVSSLV